MGSKRSTNGLGMVIDSWSPKIIDAQNPLVVFPPSPIMSLPITRSICRMARGAARPVTQRRLASNSY